jgi:uncharacterized protein
LYQRKASTTKVVKSKKERKMLKKFSQYFDSEPLTKAPSHRLLAILRAENMGFIKFKVEVDVNEVL